MGCGGERRLSTRSRGELPTWRRARCSAKYARAAGVLGSTASPRAAADEEEEEEEVGVATAPVSPPPREPQDCSARGVAASASALSPCCRGRWSAEARGRRRGADDRLPNAPAGAPVSACSGERVLDVESTGPTSDRGGLANRTRRGVNEASLPPAASRSGRADRRECPEVEAEAEEEEEVDGLWMGSWLWCGGAGGCSAASVAVCGPRPAYCARVSGLQAGKHPAWPVCGPGTDVPWAVCAAATRDRAATVRARCRPLRARAHQNPSEPHGTRSSRSARAGQGCDRGC